MSRMAVAQPLTSVHCGAASAQRTRPASLPLPLQAAGKPLLMEEFGVWDGMKDEQLRYYSLVYDLISEVGSCLLHTDQRRACSPTHGCVSIRSQVQPAPPNT